MNLKYLFRYFSISTLDNTLIDNTYIGLPIRIVWSWYIVLLLIYRNLSIRDIWELMVGFSVTLIGILLQALFTRLITSTPQEMGPKKRSTKILPLRKPKNHSLPVPCLLFLWVFCTDCKHCWLPRRKWDPKTSYSR